MAEGGASPPSASMVVTEDPKAKETRSPQVVLKLKKPKSERQVKWTEETVDNEFMNKKKSKCCCIYEKPKTAFDESSSEDDSDDECGHCQGHKKKCYRNINPEDEGGASGGADPPAPPNAS